MSRPIVLLTDLGRGDPRVGMLKGAILGANPSARIVDLSLDIPPRDVWTTAFYLATCSGRFPLGTLFLAAVAPGDGAERRLLWARTARRQYLFPDNGCISWLALKEPLLEMRHVAARNLRRRGPHPISTALDILAPVAGALSRGLAPARLGKTVRVCYRMPWPAAHDKNGDLRGVILAVKGNGAAVTNLTARRPASVGRLRLRGSPIRGARLLRDESGFLALDMPGGGFAAHFRARPADPIEILRHGRARP